MLLYLVPMLGHSLFRICSLSSLSRFLSLKMPEEESDLGALDLGGSDGGLGGSDAPADSKAHISKSPHVLSPMVSSSLYMNVLGLFSHLLLT
jgi:hypothetical protein